MKIALRIDYNDSQSKEVICTPADVVKFEATFDMSIGVMQENAKFTHLLWLAWASETRTKSTTKSFDEWIEDIAMIEAGESNPK